MPCGRSGADAFDGCFMRRDRADWDIFGQDAILLVLLVERDYAVAGHRRENHVRFGLLDFVDQRRKFRVPQRDKFFADNLATCLLQHGFGFLDAGHAEYII